MIASRPKDDPDPEVHTWNYNELNHLEKGKPLRGSTVSILHTKTTLVVCPLRLLNQWEQQLQEHAPELTFTVYKTEKLLDGDVVAEMDEMRRTCAPPPSFSGDASSAVPQAKKWAGAFWISPPSPTTRWPMLACPRDV